VALNPLMSALCDSAQLSSRGRRRDGIARHAYTGPLSGAPARSAQVCSFTGLPLVGAVGRSWRGLPYPSSTHQTPT
jgi:hypothetical protein